MHFSLSQSQSRKVDQIAIEQFGLPGIALMENAGRGCAELLLSYHPRQVTIVTGKGNNAGDGFVIARFLHNRGIDVEIALLSPPEQLPGDARINWEVIQKMGIRSEEFFSEQVLFEKPIGKNTHWIVDAILGTGLNGNVRSPISTAINQINEAKANEAKVFAVDLPSGIHCDTGEVLGIAVNADITATFVATKLGLTFPEGKKNAGTIELIDIGAPQEAIELALKG